MKYVIILPDGAADDPLPQLGGRTPLEAAHIPHMDSIARTGRFGRVVTIPPGYIPGTDVGTLTLMGYDPNKYYSGRAPIEATARRLSATPDQLIFRCNFVTIADGRMKDFTAGHISQADADALIATLRETVFAEETCAFHAGVSYRNLMFLSQADQMKVVCTPPHDISDQPVAGYLPRGEGSDRVQRIMDRAAKVLADHPVNVRRRERGEAWATNIWLWGQGRPVRLETLQERYGLSGSCITAVDIIRGIAVGMDLELIHVPGATGYIDTDYDAKGKAAIEALARHDVVVVHVEAPDEAAHQGMADEKVQALSRIDEAIVGPLLDVLKKQGEWRMLIAPDHATQVSTKAHCSKPPPFAFAGTGIDASGAQRFTEINAIASGVLLDPGHSLLDSFLRG